MNYIIDLVLLAFIALTTYIGYKRGLIKVAFKLVSFVLAIVIAVILYKPLSTLIIKYTPLDETIEQTVESRLTSSETSKEEADNMVANYFNQVKNASKAAMAKAISQAIIQVSCILIVFIVATIILLLFKFSGDLLAKLPIIKQLNSVGGFIYGLLLGFVILYILFALISLLAPIANINNIIKLINSSILANIMYHHNIILLLFA